MATSSAQIVQPEVGIPVTSGIVKTSNGSVVRQTELSNGTVVTTEVFADDYEPVPNAKPNKAGDIEMRLVANPAPIAPPAR